MRSIIAGCASRCVEARICASDLVVLTRHDHVLDAKERLVQYPLSREEHGRGEEGDRGDNDHRPDAAAAASR